MKIALCALNGSWSHTNLAIRCLRAPLVREGFEVVLCEHTLRDRTAHIIEGLAGECADVYGFSCYIWNIVPLLDIAHALHQIRPHAKIILGGPEVSFATERFATLDYIDAIVCGEGEEAMLEICQKIAQNQSFSRIISKNPLPYMRNEGILYQNGEHTGEILYYESSRGCPFRCAYCLSSTDTHPRYKTVEQTIDDLKAFERLDGGCKIIKFVDRTFNFNIDRANQIWRALLSDTFSKHYHFEVCATLLNEESFEIFAQFPKGKIQLEIGLQSTHIPTLEASARHLSPEKTIATAKRIFEMGNIHVHLDLIAGLPYETYTRFAQSFDDAYGSCHMLQLGFLKLLHGTALREHKAQYGYAFLQKWAFRTYPVVSHATHDLTSPLLGGAGHLHSHPRPSPLATHIPAGCVSLFAPICKRGIACFRRRVARDASRGFPRGRAQSPPSFSVIFVFDYIFDDKHI